MYEIKNYQFFKIVTMNFFYVRLVGEPKGDLIFDNKFFFQK